MPVQYTYPGVYVEEIPSGVRTITGVSTSDTAFVDWFVRGPADKAVRITNFGEFERTFGGLDPRSEASYAIQQFFRNGGSVTWVVRVLAGSSQTASRTLQGGSPPQNTLTVQAASPGKWGNSLRVGVDRKTPDPDTFFNLVAQLVEVVDNKEQIVASETYRNLTMKDKTSPQYALTVVNNSSTLIQLKDEGLGELPLSAADADVISKPRPGDFFQLGLYGGNVGSDGDTPPSFPGDPNGSNWITLSASGAAALKGSQTDKKGMYALEKIAPFIFSLLCIPAAANLADGNMVSVYSDALTLCIGQRAFLIVDIPSSIETVEGILTWMDQDAHSGLRHENAAIYFPRLDVPDARNNNRPRNVGPSGTLAGVYARTDATRGVWKAPAGTDAVLRGASLRTILTDQQNGALNPQGINALRNFPVFGNISWGGRTLNGADQKASEWKYIPVRRMALFIEESLYQGLKWVVFEPNDEPLWAQIRLNVGAFMQNLFRQGAFQGSSPREAYFVKCDKETTTQNDINLGIVNILVGFAPLKPAEFVVIKIQQMAGQVEA